MIALIRYMLVSYTRSYRYFAPMAFIVISVMLIYSYRPNPIMSSYAVTSTLLFIGSAWLGLNYFNHDQGRQSMLLIIHSGKPIRYYAAQYITAALLSMIFSLFAVLYPIMLGMFDKPISLSEFALGYLGHVALALLGISLSAFFQFGFIENQGRAAGLLIILIVISIAGQTLEQKIPSAIGSIIYLLPPVSTMIDLFMHVEERSTFSIFTMIVYSYLYSFILLAIYLWTVCRRDASALSRKVG